MGREDAEFALDAFGSALRARNLAGIRGGGDQFLKVPLT